MTAPQPPVTHARVFAIAGPAMAANLTTPLLGIVAMAAVGRLGDATALGGVALAAAAFSLTFAMFNFLRTGTVGFVAQALGAGNALEMLAVLLRGLMIAATIGVSLIALQGPLSQLIFYTYGGSEAVTSAAKLYFNIRIWSAPLLLANSVILGWLVGQARAKTALGIQVVVNVVNMAVTSLLVLVFHFGIAGAAIAPIVAESTGLALGLSVAWRTTRGSSPVPRTQLLQREKFIRLMSVNRDIMIRTAALQGGFLIFNALGARNGDLVLASNAVLYPFITIGSFFLDGLSAAASQLGGRAIGAHDRDGFVSTTKFVLGWGFVFAVTVSLIFSFGGGYLVDVITTSEEVRAAARHTLWLAAIAPLCGVAAYGFDGIYIGATWSRDMRNLMVIAFIVYLAALVLLQPLGNYGLWGALLSFLFVRGVLQALRYPALLRKSFGESFKGA